MSKSQQKRQLLKWHVEQRSVNDLKPYKNNPRIIKGKKFEDLKKSLSSFGVAQLIAINTDGTVIGGHARLFALQELGIETVDCYVPERELTKVEFEELNIRFNHAAGEFDFEMLANRYKVEELLAWGFETQDFGMDMDFNDEEKKKKDEGQYKNVTFKLHENQADFVKEILDEAKEELILDGPNKNDRGNALYTICKEWQELKGKK